MDTPVTSPPARRSAGLAVPSSGGPGELDQFSHALLSAMLSFKQGDFSVRLPSALTGVDGKIADAFNDIVLLSERRARETSLVTHAVGREGKLKQRMNVAGAMGGWADEVAAINTLIDDLVWPTTEVTRAVGAVAKGDLGQSMALEVDGRPLEGEFLRSARLVNNMIDQLSVFTSEVTRVAREVGTEGKLGGQAQVQRSLRCLEGADRVGEPDGRQPDRPGPQHRRRHDCGRQRRPVQEDHGRRPRRDPPAQGSHQHDGRPAPRLRRGGDARRARGRHRRQARRAGGRAGRGRHLEGPDRLGQRDGVEPDGAGPQHRRRDDGRRARRPVAQDHRRRQGRDSRAQGHRQHDGRPAERVRLRGEPRRARGRHRRQARRAGGSARRRRHVEGSDRLGQRDGREPDGAGAQHRRGHHRRRARRSLAQDHRRRQGRDSRAQGHHQHDGRSAERLCLRSHARRARGRHRGQTGRTGRGARRRRHVEEPHRLGQLDGQQPHRPGPQHRLRRDRRSRAATCRARSRSTSRARFSSSRTPSTRWSTS